MSKPHRRLPTIDGTADPRADTWPGDIKNAAPHREFNDTDLKATWKRRVLKSDNDFIIGIAASSRTPISGTGKTTLAVRLARHFDASDGGFDAQKKAALSSEAVSEDLIPKLPARSSIIFDEAQGTLSSDGVDSRRAMANAVVDMARSAAQFRKRQHTLLVVSQSSDWIDSRMMDLLDRLIIIQERGRAVVYDHYRDDLPNSGESREYTPAKEEISWKALPDDDPDYQALDRMKEEAGGQGGAGDGEEDISLTKAQQKVLAQSLRDEGWTLVRIADHPQIDFERSWVSEHTEVTDDD
jgi:hypothetical protein